MGMNSFCAVLAD